MQRPHTQRVNQAKSDPRGNRRPTRATADQSLWLRLEYLEEEVRQLRAAVRIYTEIARRLAASNGRQWPG
ncbi:MAG TPA: hypothetical protein VGH38_25055 [Bryobacteraceae bacterium]